MCACRSGSISMCPGGGGGLIVAENCISRRRQVYFMNYIFTNFNHQFNVKMKQLAVSGDLTEDPGVLCHSGFYSRSHDHEKLCTLLTIPIIESIGVNVEGRQESFSYHRS